MPSSSTGTREFEPGSRVGHYQLLRRLAVGGMAELFLARAEGIEGFEKLVVLKRMLPRFAATDEYLAMFLDEARLAARLAHPNITQVYDIGEHAGSYYFTMEFVHGEDVRTLLKERWAAGKAVPLEHALAIVIGVAAALHAAHESVGIDGAPLGIVHRDVSPSNVLVTYDGGVKLIDFGIAKGAGRRSETKTGMVKGKASYMSPEQCRGELVDRRSDVYSLGILLYELTVSQRLFTGSSELDIMNTIVRGEVPRPGERVESYPAALERIVLRALATQRDERYSSARALQLDLEQFARQARLTIATGELGDLMREQFADRASLSRLLESSASAAGARASTAAEASHGALAGHRVIGAEQLDRLDTCDLLPEMLRIETVVPDRQESCAETREPVVAGEDSGECSIVIEVDDPARHRPHTTWPYAGVPVPLEAQRMVLPASSAARAHSLQWRLLRVAAAIALLVLVSAVALWRGSARQVGSTVGAGAGVALLRRIANPAELPPMGAGDDAALVAHDVRRAIAAPRDSAARPAALSVAHGARGEPAGETALFAELAAAGILDGELDAARVAGIHAATAAAEAGQEPAGRAVQAIEPAVRRARRASRASKSATGSLETRRRKPRGSRASTRGEQGGAREASGLRPPRTPAVKSAATEQEWDPDSALPPL